MSIKITPSKIPEVLLIEPEVHVDERGFFFETFQAMEFSDHGIPSTFVQDNHTGSRGGILRGLHYQIRRTQGKLVRVLIGDVFDVAVDLRRSSPTFGQWVGTTLSAEDHHQLWIPEGFAHGFYVLSEWAELLYKVTDYYAPEWDRTLLWNDPEVGIEWPIDEGKIPVLSEKDVNGKRLFEAEVFE